MIDFRYHLISIIAVLLALSIGIVTGSGFLGGRLLQEVRSAARRVGDRNQALRVENAEISGRADAAESALETLEPELLAGALVGRRIVMVEFEGADGEAAGQVQSAMVEAGAQMVGVIRFQEQLSLDDPAARAAVAALLGDTSVDAADLQVSLADSLGQALNQAVAPSSGDEARLDGLLADLEEAGLVVTENLAETIPAGSDVVIAGGAVPEPAWPVADFAVTLAQRVAGDEEGVLVAEPTQSTWDMAGTIRRDGAAQDLVWTVDDSETVLGRVAAVFVLERIAERPAQHFGTAPGASAVVPGVGP